MNRDFRFFLGEAFQYAQKQGFDFLTPEMVLMEIIKEEDIRSFLGDGSYHQICEELSETMECVDRTGKNPKMSHAMREIKANVITDVAEFFQGLTEYAKESLAAFIVEERHLADALKDPREKVGGYSSDNDEDEDTPNIEEVFAALGAIEMTAPEYCKDKQYVGSGEPIMQIQEILACKNKPNPMLHGEAGVGKTATVEGLCLKIRDGDVPECFKRARIFSLQIADLVAGTQYRGQLEQKVKTLVQALRKEKNVYLFIDEIHTVLRAGAVEGGASDIAQILKPALARGEIKLIAATTTDEMRRMESDKALMRRFQKVHIKEPSPSETKAILQGVLDRYEKFHGLSYKKGSIEAIIELAPQCFPEGHSPDKEITLVDIAGAAAKIAGRPSIDRGFLKALVSKKIGTKVIMKDDAVAVTNNIASAMEEVKKSVIGHDSNIEAVFRAVKIHKAGLKADFNKPIGSYMFIGPTGVGKTHLAQQLAEKLGMELIRFDMGEFSEEISVAKIIGTSAGYVGYDEGGRLVNEVRKNPRSVILFDEIEKAHSKVYDTLLQVMDAGIITDGKGVSADFKECIIIFTSNVGVAEALAKKPTVGFVSSTTAEMAKESITAAFEKAFSPEFRNRLTKTMMFEAIDEATGRKIAEKQLEQLQEQLAPKKVSITFTEDVISKVVKEGVSPAYGAREIKRQVDMIRDVIIDAIIDGGITDMTIEVVDGEYRYTAKTVKPPKKKAKAKKESSEAVSA